ncbi:MAG: VWA domain-containing protein [Candidatus Kapaibacterium sp.]
MKKSRFHISLASFLSIVTATLLFEAGCRTVTGPGDPGAKAGPPTSLPSAAIVGIHPDPASGNSGDFEIDLYIVDSSGHALTTIGANSISILNGFDTLFSQTNVSTATSALFGSYSAGLLLDQTGSIRFTDPLNLRLLAAKIFLGATSLLNPADEVQLSTFQDSLHIDGEYLHSYGPFTHNTGAFEDTVETLASKIGGGTPLYDAMYDETDSVALQGKNANRALVVFTDGEDNESYMYYPGATLWDAIHHAIQQHVKVFAVALQTGLDTALTSAAMQTGGAILQASDAKQMVSYFGAMPSMLHGGVHYYRTKWHVSVPNAGDLSGQVISGNLSITLPDHSNVIAPFAITFP